MRALFSFLASLFVVIICSAFVEFEGVGAWSSDSNIFCQSTKLSVCRQCQKMRSSKDLLWGVTVGQISPNVQQLRFEAAGAWQFVQPTNRRPEAALLS